jgi:hypothetical protein
MSSREILAAPVLDAFGGLTATSRALGHRNPTTVQGWKQSGRIPPWRKSEIEAAAQRLGIKMPWHEDESASEPQEKVA